MYKPTKSVKSISFGIFGITIALLYLSIFLKEVLIVNELISAYSSFGASLYNLNFAVTKLIQFDNFILKIIFK